jgi:hypothetical protein
MAKVIEIRKCCSECGRKFTNRSSKAVDKKFSEDVAKAQRAIEICLAWQGDKYDSPETVAAVSEANQSEAERLTEALSDPKLLWSIYRRRDKASGYASAFKMAA